MLQRTTAPPARSQRAPVPRLASGAAPQRVAARRAPLAVRASAADADYRALQGCRVQRVGGGESVDLLSLWQVSCGRAQPLLQALRQCESAAVQQSARVRIAGPA